MKAKLLVSACLLGIPCRYDAKSKIGEFGAEKRSLEEILPALSERYELVPFCPEIYGGLPTPRSVLFRKTSGVRPAVQRDFLLPL